MKRNLFKALSIATLCGFMLAFASCVNEDITQKKTDTDNNNDKNLTTFATGTAPESRTSMDYNSGAFFWEAGDYIYVKDGDNVWQKSSNAPTTQTAYFKFKVPGKFAAKTSYKVYYPGKNGNKDQVTISATQTQTEPNTTTHLGESGDCGTADATKVTGKNRFEFKLDHQAAYLVFQPYTSNTVLKNCYITKIEVNSDNDISSTYTLDPTTGELTGTGTGKQIVLTTKGSGAFTNGFPLTNTSADVATNGAFMVIKPGTHTFKIQYWVKDIVTKVEGTISKVLISHKFDKNKYYNMTASLDVRDYDGNHYYLWDAGEQCWKGHEWNQGGSQPTLNEDGVNPSSAYNDYPKNNSDPRWHSEVYPGYGIKNDAQTVLFKSLPNVNEMTWYAFRGDPRWDADELWTTMGHLYKGGMWFLKKDNISGYSAEHAYDGSDWRIIRKEEYNLNLLPNLPSAAEINKYFYLPATGYYNYYSGLQFCGQNGIYWSSSAGVWSNGIGYNMNIFSGGLMVTFEGRQNSLRAQPFSDFGED